MCYHPFFFPWFGGFFLIFLLLMLFRRRWYRGGWGGSCYGYYQGNSPENILAERFAKGEIDEKEYTDRLAVLKARSKS